jgi:protein-disulfide isomerase
MLKFKLINNLKIKIKIKIKMKIIKNNFLVISILLSAIFISGAILLSENKMNIEEFDKNLETYQERAEARELNNSTIKEVLKIQENDRVLGNRDADVTIFEYSDFECPFCKKFYTESDKAVKEFEGRVNLVYRHFPGLHQPLAIVEANAAECAGEQAGDEGFFKYHNELYKRTQSNGRSLTKQSGRGLDVSELPKIALSLALDMDKFNKCSASMKFESKVRENMQSGSKIGVTGTPNSFIVNNKTGEVRKIGGYVSFAPFLKEKIEEVL